MSVGQGSQFFTHYQALLFDVDILPYPLTWEGDPHVEQKEAVALQAFDAYLQRYPNEVAGVLIEPLVQGASGMRMCRPQFLQGLAKRVKEAKVLLLFDEVMTGFGRTGQWFASHTAQVTPDVICLSKGITAGFLPLSVTVCSEPVYEAFLGETFDRAFVHGHSFTANPLGCAAALASLKVFEQESTLAKLPQIESWHREYLAPLMAHPKVEQVRICGTIAAFNVKASESTYGSSLGERLKGVFMEQGVLMRPLGNTVYLLPPYCITKDELALGYQAIDKALAII
jgi:adenosylmethionine-8-amino-7-oxononanoate aminotransferase